VSSHCSSTRVIGLSTQYMCRVRYSLTWGFTVIKAVARTHAMMHVTHLCTHTLKINKDATNLNKFLPRGRAPFLPLGHDLGNANAVTR